MYGMAIACGDALLLRVCCVLAYAMLLRWRYAMPGARIGYAATKLMLLRGHAATNNPAATQLNTLTVSYSPTRVLREVRY
eukprot:1392094-Rhodomonas_salina.4